VAGSHAVLHTGTARGVARFLRFVEDGDGHAGVAVDHGERRGVQGFAGIPRVVEAFGGDEALVRNDLAERPPMPICAPSASERQTYRYAPPTRRSMSHCGIDLPGGPSNQRRTSSGRVNALNTVADASKSRVTLISLSLGVDTLKLAGNRMGRSFNVF